MAANQLGRNITFQIYNADGTSFHNLVLRKSTVNSVVMSLGDNVTGYVYYKDNNLAITMQEYIIVKKNPNDANEDGVRYTLVNPPTIQREGMVSENSELKGMTKYSFTFYHPMYALGNIPFTDIAVTLDEKKYLSQNSTFNWIGTLFEFVAKLNANLADTEWLVEANIPQYEQDGETVTADWTKASELSDVLSFDKQFISDALKTAYDTWEIPYTITSINRNGKKFLVEFGLPSQEIYDTDGVTPFVFQMGKGVGLKNNSRTPKNNKIVTRISGYGSEGNIPYGYPQIPWYGDPTWDYTIDNDSTNPNSYPIYNGIWGGANVRLIKHPFTRKNLMPSIYSETVFNKVSPYQPHGAIPSYNQTLAGLMDAIDIKISQAESQDEIAAYNHLKSVLTAVNNTSGATSQSFSDSATQGEIYEGFVRKYSSELIDGYVTGVTGDFEFESVLDLNKFLVANTSYDPDTQIIDYYDATAPEYPNPIVLSSPSFESHQFEDIKPRLGDAMLAGVSAYYTPSEVPQYLTVSQVIINISDMLATEMNVPNERAAVIALREALIAGEMDYSDSKQGGSYNYEASVTHDDFFLYVKFQSSIHSFEYVALYADSYPVVWDDSMDDEGNYKQSYFKVTLPQLAFDIYACASITEEMEINMRSGACLGCTFKVQVDWEDYKAVFYDDNGNFDPDGEKRQSAIDRYPYSNRGQITIIVAKDLDTFGTLMPNVYQQPHTGDKFVILGISLPTSYIAAAEQELDEAMMEYMLENNIPHYDYPLKIDEYFLANRTDILLQMQNNSIFRFVYAGTQMNLYIKEISIKYFEGVLPQYDITLTDDVEVVLNQIGKTVEDVSRMRVQMSELQAYYQQNFIDELKNKLDKVVDDVCQGRITFQQGLNSIGDAIFSGDVKSDIFQQGMYDGRGWRIDELGNAEFESIRARSFLEVVELLVNRMQAQEGDTAFSDNDQIDRVDKITSGGVTSYVLSLKEKWEGYVTAQLVGNILRGVVNTLAAKDAGVSDETSNNPSKQGSDDGGNKYYTSWMRVVDTSETDNTLSTNQIRVVLYGDGDVPAGKNFEPCELMTVARWGCALNPNEQGISEAEKQSRIRRQRMFMISVSDGRVVKYTNVNSPILRNTNYGVTIGELPDFVKEYTDVARVLNLVGEHSDWLYAQGVVVQNFIKVNVDGDPEIQYVDCGEWVDGSQTASPSPRNGVYLVNEWNPTAQQYETNDVWHNGCKWRCLQHQPVSSGGTETYYEPKWNSPYWQMVEGNSNYSIEFASSNGFSFRAGHVNTTITPHLFYGNIDITADIAAEYWNWTRESESGKSEADYTWDAQHQHLKQLSLTNIDMPVTWSSSNKAIFTCTVTVNDGKTTIIVDNQIIS